ncbi:hypothetical protein [Phocaeicola sp.]
MYLQALILMATLFVALPIASSSGDYAQTFGADWTWAAENAACRRIEWGEVFASLDADAAECEAVIFPEQLRYSRLKDGMEQAALHVLYVQGGKETGNFSIGVFQMKPSFAEQVEKAWMNSPMRHTYKLYFDLQNSRESRRRRLKRLTDDKWQCVYVAVFIRLMLDREPLLRTLPSEERVRSLATAYNFSFTASLDVLRQQQDRKTFHLDMLPSKKTVYYSYADIAAQWYNSLKYLTKLQ